MKQHRLVILLVTLIVVCVAAIVLPRLEWVETKHRVGIKPEARENDFLAAQRLMAAQGDKTDTVRDALTLRDLPANATLLVGNAWDVQDAEQRKRLVAWVRRGGHLMLALTDGASGADILEELGIVPVGSVHEDVTQLLPIDVEGHTVKAQLDYAVLFKLRLPGNAQEAWNAPIEMAVKPPSPDEENDEETSEEEEQNSDSASASSASSPPVQMTPIPQSAPHASPLLTEDNSPAEGDDTSGPAGASEPSASTISECVAPDLSNRKFVLPANAGPDAEIETQPVFARWQLGKGWVTVGNLHIGANNGLLIGEHAKLFVRLATIPGERRSFHVLLEAPYPSLASWLWKNAAFAMLAMCVLIAAFLWRYMPRFGALVPEPLPARPGLREHLGAIGDFLLREKQYEALIAPLREDVVSSLQSLRGRHPELDDLAELGARVSGMDVREVRAALTPLPTDAHELRLRSRSLAQLQRACRALRATSTSSSPVIPRPEGTSS
ncbi:DUF4350 domain-containing protein [Viridibacterium curvum]|uniref:DUF4350 domain-containing protein n=1 Tax=Viridibacterium curvum TaxID=1101404 RepID=A0ABP9QJL2_9RHOO